MEFAGGVGLGFLGAVGTLFLLDTLVLDDAVSKAIRAKAAKEKPTTGGEMPPIIPPQPPTYLGVDSTLSGVKKRRRAI